MDLVGRRQVELLEQLGAHLDAGRGTEVLEGLHAVGLGVVDAIAVAVLLGAELRVLGGGHCDGFVGVVKGRWITKGVICPRGKREGKTRDREKDSNRPTSGQGTEYDDGVSWVLALYTIKPANATTLLEEKPQELPGTEPDLISGHWHRGGRHQVPQIGTEVGATLCSGPMLVSPLLLLSLVSPLLLSLSFQDHHSFPRPIGGEDLHH